MTAPLVVPLFPLASVVLVPGALLPLHVFEPRYRRLLADAMAGDRRIAMAMPLALRPGDDPDRPRLHPVAGLGRIVHHRAHPDGRGDIVLAGIARIRVLREVPGDLPYRVAEADELPDVAPADDAGAAAAAESALALVDSLTELSDDDRAKLLAAPPGRVADAVLLRLDVPAPEKHRIHANPRVAERVAAVRRVVARLAGVRFPGDIGPGDPRLN